MKKATATFALLLAALLGLGVPSAAQITTSAEGLPRCCV
jgi:hypothetical protein